MDKETAVPETKPLLKLTAKQISIVLLLFALLLITVGLLAGLIKPNCRSLSVRKSSEPWLSSRLPGHVLPLHYDLALFPDFYDSDQGGGARFHGNVSIWINITSKPTRHLLVHAHRLTIHQTTVRRHGYARPLRIVRMFQFTRNQYWVVELASDLEPGSSVWLEMRFEGSMVGRLAGLYRTSYVDSRTQQTRLAYLYRDEWSLLGGDRSFAAAGPRAWNRLPPPLRRVHSAAVFKRQLKTFLFDRAFN